MLPTFSKKFLNNSTIEKSLEISYVQSIIEILTAHKIYAKFAYDIIGKEHVEENYQPKKIINIGYIYLGSKLAFLSQESSQKNDLPTIYYKVENDEVTITGGHSREFLFPDDLIKELDSYSCSYIYFPS